MRARELYQCRPIKNASRAGVEQEGLHVGRASLAQAGYDDEQHHQQMQHRHHCTK